MRWTLLLLLLTGCVQPASLPSEDRAVDATSSLQGFSYYSAGNCIQMETRLPVPAGRLARWVPAGHEPWVEAGQAVLRVATWHCEGLVMSQTEANVSFSSVSVLLRPEPDLDLLEEYVLWAGTSQAGLKGMLDLAGWAVPLQPLHVSRSSMTPDVGPLNGCPADLTFSAAVSAGDGALGSMVGTTACTPVYKVPPPASVWWHEEAAARQRFAFGLPLRDLWGVAVAGFLTAPPQSPLAEVLGSTGQPAVFVVRFPAFNAEVHAEPI